MHAAAGAEKIPGALSGHPAEDRQRPQRQGFEPAEKYGIRNSENMFAAALHICGLSDGALDGINGKYYENEIYNVDDEAVKEFDKNFPPKKLISGTLSQQYFLEISAKCKPFKNN